jgi:anti-anti-sigma factor
MEVSVKMFGLSGLKVKAEGRLDLENAVTFGTTVKNSIADSEEPITELVIDFEKISFISSFGLKVILELYKCMKEQNGSLKLINVSEQIKNSFRMVGFDKFLELN